MIQEMAQNLYPKVWGTSETELSTIGKIIKDLNGDCGWGYLGTNKNPNKGECTGYMSYSDDTCDWACNITEGGWLLISSYLGAFMY